MFLCPYFTTKHSFLGMALLSLCGGGFTKGDLKKLNCLCPCHVERTPGNPILSYGLNSWVFSIFDRVTCLGEGKSLNSNLKDCCLGKSVAHWCTILLLSVDSMSVISSIETFTHIKKSSIFVIQHIFN